MSLTRKLGQAVPGSSAEHSLAKQALLASAAYPERQGDYHGNADFLELAPDTRNQIYEYAYRFHSRIGQQITVCNEEGAREVPAAISRTCKQVRSEMLPYFIDKATVVFIAHDIPNLKACREWMNFTPGYAIEMIQTIRIKHAHPTTFSRSHKCVNTFELTFCPFSTQNTSYWGQGHETCSACVPKGEGSVKLVLRVRSALQAIYAEGKVTSRRLTRVFDMLETAMRRPKLVDS